VVPREDPRGRKHNYEGVRVVKGEGAISESRGRGIFALERLGVKEGKISKYLISQGGGEGGFSKPLGGGKGVEGDLVKAIGKFIDYPRGRGEGREGADPTRVPLRCWV
jgi:hypothetical protein